MRSETDSVVAVPTPAPAQTDTIKSNLRCSCNHQVDLQGLRIPGPWSLLQLSSPEGRLAIRAPSARVRVESAARCDKNTALARSSSAPFPNESPWAERKRGLAARLRSAPRNTRARWPKRTRGRPSRSALISCARRMGRWPGVARCGRGFGLGAQYNWGIFFGRPDGTR